MDFLPRLVVVTGQPGAGKSTLAQSIAREMRCPTILRDEIKEGRVATLGSAPSSHDELNVEVNAAFFAVLRSLLQARVTVVAEAAFQHRLWAPALEPMRSIADVKLIVCDVPTELAVARRIARALADPERDVNHGDPVLRAAREGRLPTPTPYEPPNLSVPTMTVDTQEGYTPGFAAIVAFARRSSIESESEV